MPKLAHRHFRARALFLIAAAVIAIAALGFVLTTGESMRAAPLVESAASAPVAAASAPQGEALLAPPVPVGADGSSAVRTDLIRAESTPDSPPQAADAAARDDGAELALAGRFVEYRDGSLLHLAGSGSVLAHVAQHGSARAVDVEVTKGRFELWQKPDAGGMTSFDEGSRTGADAEALTVRVDAPIIEGEGRYELFDPQANEVRASARRFPWGTKDAVIAVQRAAAVELFVLDKSTGSHLSGVQVFAKGPGGGFSTVDPTGQSYPSLHTNATSPVRLEVGVPPFHSRRQKISVGAEGYAWGAITVDLTTPGQRTIELVRSGSLRISLKGSVRRGPVLRLLGSGGFAAERRVSESEMLIEHLAPGDYAALIFVGESTRSAAQVAQGKATVKAGLETSLVLEIPPQEAVEKADLRGRLFLPPEWQIRSPRATVERISKSMSGGATAHPLGSGDFKALDGQPGWYSFALSGLETGRYAMILEQLKFAEPFDLPPEGLSNFLFVTPPPIDFTVALEDAATGEDVPGISTIYWSGVCPEGLRSWGSKGVQRNPTTGDFSMHVPAGEITLDAGFQFSHKPFVIKPLSGERVVLKVKKSPKAFIELRYGKEKIPWPHNFHIKVKDEAGERVNTSFGSTGSRRFIKLEEPGTYFLEIPEISGFRPVAPVEIEMKSDSTPTLVIELERS